MNTDLDNRRALDLYRRHGFAELPERLSVLAVPLEGDGSRRRDPSESDR